MYPDLSYLFNDIFGTSVDNWISIFKTFGFLLVVALACCGILLKYELRQKEKEGLILPKNITVVTTEKQSIQDILINSLFMLILGAKLPLLILQFDRFKGDPASFVFSKMGMWYIGLAAAITTVVYSLWKNKSADPNPKHTDILQYPSEKTNDIIIIAGLSGVLGSKLFSITEDLSGFFKDPLGTLFAGSGLNVFGGLILAFIAVYYYVKSIGIKPVYMMDIAGMGILLGYAVGRIGCQLSGDGDWGIEAASQPSWWFLPDWLWSYNYPNNVNNSGDLLSNCDPETYRAAISQGLSTEDSCVKSCGIRYCHELNPRVYPTPIYETLFSLTSLALLWFNKHRFSVPGMIFFTYMIINGIERFFIEKIRVNEKYEMLGLNWSQAQYISILFILGGIAGLIYLITNRAKNIPIK
ncbi:MAG: prolipoprotein diacylglyceryl transferase [Saprospiraceae bacterium]|nr:prolipoprotein diacylglyceryl transferase [Saprospiraceae bacterium]